MALLTALLLLGGCGGGSNGGSRARNSVVSVVMATAPNSLDPAVGSNPEALEADWLAYTPLLTYAHSDGAPGTHVVAGLAQTLPLISNGGRGYTFTLRPGLRYSDGQPVRARDFERAVERAIELWSPARQLIVPRIVGARAFAQGRARTISGITSNDASGQITIDLTAADGTFENVLALPALAPVPPGTPMREQQTAPPPGVGPYRLAGVMPGRSFALIRNPGWSVQGVSGVPAGRVDVDVRIGGDPKSGAQAVLEDRADVLDWTDPVPAALLGQIGSRAADRYLARAMQSTYLIFMNPHRSPFSSGLAREAVRAGLDQATLASLDSGALRAGCYVLPPTIFGHPHNACPGDNADGNGNLAVARSLLKRSGMAGTPVTVWSETDAMVSRWMTYYTALLNQIGLRARLRSVPDTSYYATIANRHEAAQTGFGELDQVLPNPAVFYQQLTGRLVPGDGGHNWSQVDDPHVNATVQALAAVPASTLQGIEGFWEALDLYVARQAEVAVIGYRTVPEFVSSRIDFSDLVLSPVAGYDWSSIRLK